MWNLDPARVCQYGPPESEALVRFYITVPKAALNVCVYVYGYVCARVVCVHPLRENRATWHAGGNFT